MSAQTFGRERSSPRDRERERDRDRDRDRDRERDRDRDRTPVERDYSSRERPDRNGSGDRPRGGDREWDRAAPVGGSGPTRITRTADGFFTPPSAPVSSRLPRNATVNAAPSVEDVLVGSGEITRGPSLGRIRRPLPSASGANGGGSSSDEYRRPSVHESSRNGSGSSTLEQTTSILQSKLSRDPEGYFLPPTGSPPVSRDRGDREWSDRGEDHERREKHRDRSDRERRDDGRQPSGLASRSETVKGPSTISRSRPRPEDGFSSDVIERKATTSRLPDRNQSEGSAKAGNPNSISRERSLRGDASLGLDTSAVANGLRGSASANHFYDDMLKSLSLDAAPFSAAPSTSALSTPSRSATVQSRDKSRDARGVERLRSVKDRERAPSGASNLAAPGDHLDALHRRAGSTENTLASQPSGSGSSPIGAPAASTHQRYPKERSEVEGSRSERRSPPNQSRSGATALDAWDRDPDKERAQRRAERAERERVAATAASAADVMAESSSSSPSSGRRHIPDRETMERNRQQAIEDMMTQEQKEERARLLKEKEERERAEAKRRERLNEQMRKEEEAELAARKQEKKELQRRELERQDAERRMEQVERMVQNEDSLFNSPLDASIVVPQYVQDLIRTLNEDPTLTPTPDDFSTVDGFPIFQRTVRAPLQKVISDIVFERFVDGPARRAAAAAALAAPAPAPVGPSSYPIFFKVVSAADLQAKDIKAVREIYCQIDVGNGPEESKNQKLENETFMTEAVKATTSPVWNQHINCNPKSLGDKVLVSVWDQKKEFLGQVKLNINDMIEESADAGYVSKWYPLLPREGKRKDKFVGGDILIEFEHKVERAPAAPQARMPTSSYLQKIHTQLVNCRINFKSLYRVLLRACLDLDIRNTLEVHQLKKLPEKTQDLLSDESKTCLRVCCYMWSIGEDHQFIALASLLFERYKNYLVPVDALSSAFEAIYESLKKRDWLTTYERPLLLDTCDQMYEYYRSQVTKYKEFYPKNKPAGALESTLILWRMLYKSSFFRESHPTYPGSFSEHATSIMLEACVQRYQKLLELSAPFDNTDIEAVVDGLIGLAESLTREIELDVKYYKTAFKKDIDIVRLTSENYLKEFVKTLEEHLDMIISDEAIKSASQGIFSLYKKLRTMDEKYGKLVPGLKRLSHYAAFNVERWFSPFVTKWLDSLANQTLEWVTNAVRADNFEPQGEGGETEGGVPPHSSSVTDIFTAIYQQLDFIMDLGWSNTVQNAGFFQKFAKSVNKAIEQYCDAIGLGELRIEPTPSRTNWNILQSRQVNGPQDINLESCVKLCNIEYAVSKLDEMDKLMNVASLTQTVRDYRATIAPMKKKAPRTGPRAVDEDEEVHGAFKVQVAYAENVKPVTTAGLANGYVTIRVPDGTVVPPPDPEDLSNGIVQPSSFLGSAGRVLPTSSSGPTILSGSACELARTRVIYDTVNPSWDETFMLLLPPITRLDVCIYSKNMITADELCGRATLDMALQTRLRRKLSDHHTHDVFVETEPQGRLLLRLTMEGEEEDVNFWFRRSRERLNRTRDDFVRALCSRISPYLKEVVMKSMKEHEAAPVQQSFFSSLTGAVQYSNNTASGVSIEKTVTSGEADILLAPVTEYLDRNLSTLTDLMSPKMAKEVVKRLWDEILIVTEHVLIPPLYGQIERDRRVQNKRQVSMAEWTLRIMKEFFYAGGAEFGLSTRQLESRRFLDLSSLISIYWADLAKVKRAYELSVDQGREKEHLLRLVRLRVEKQEDFSPGDREDGRKWIEVHLSRRRGGR
ncbi:hypothetical protein DFJ73DRAFT_338207 [Zopfochytrium polystomum]|nr:hypothetical protein DFJ73DRAFT_338207 [Zopfochytrium polystomum]